MKQLVEFLSCCLVLACSFHFTEAPPVVESSNLNSEWSDFWLVRLIFNLVGYASVVVPAYLLISYLKKIKYNETGSGVCYPCVKTCVFGDDISSDLPQTSSPKIVQSKVEKSFQRKAVALVVCAIGLQVSYLTWGVIQERIMTLEYGKTDDSPGEKFTNSQFLVFINRLLAFCVAFIYIMMTRQPRHGCPLYKFSYCSFSNIMSSWFQYEALKFVSFPTQVLGKACKVIPVMLMGKVVSGNVYEMYEWITAGMLSMGISVFLLAQGDSHAHTDSVDDVQSTTVYVLLSGFILMLGYMAFDSFTSNWQGELFKTHKMSSIQMMLGVNLFSCIFTSCSLLEQGAFFEAFAFITRHVEFGMHSVVLSICSAVGQLFIFYTISEYGAVVFTIIMTLRQAFAILLSCLIYGHPIGFLGFIGVLIVFAALFLRIYARSRKANIKKLAGAGTSAKA
uniref:Adenosine 3'-phospho 5'-phosphosulfate transporter 1 n=1 Tax=Phallusia mammillata TaxID=59560 RepID=A0A6F9DS09_9ASCI|nr:adenosine 3'-phospho 5'-phosphosulfate transporter 1-like [Phallusia mammillata]